MSDIQTKLVGAPELVGAVFGKGVSARWLNDQARAGRVPSVKIGRKRLYDPANVRAILSQQTSQPKTPAS